MNTILGFKNEKRIGKHKQKMQHKNKKNPGDGECVQRTMRGESYLGCNMEFGADIETSMGRRVVRSGKDVAGEISKTQSFAQWPSLGSLLAGSC